MYKDPIMDGNQIASVMDVHISTANRMIADLQSLGILRELTGYKRNRIYILDEYVNLFYNKG